MGNISDAFKKQQAEQQQKGASAPQTAGPAETPVTKAAALSAETENVEAVSSQESSSENTSFSSNKVKKYSSDLVAYNDPGCILTEQYRSLRTNILARAKKQQVCMIITSAEANEGKTVTTLNLAFVMTELPDTRVLVIDGDLRKDRLTTMLGLDASPGLAEVLRDPSRLNEALQPTQCSNLDAISAGGAKKHEIGEVISRLSSSKLLQDLQRKYDIILVDTPPVGSASDASILGRVTGDALLVIRMNKTHRESIERAVGLLQSADVNIAGIFLTHQKSYVPRYFDYYL
ncbi:MAG: CpsD/CapB family tyrosine-protein kinase [Sedimentisphaerales bacterium]|nr:CpsD/CapB family tyrosine-protein kinase [Sedimentisphaerales bacterium]